MLHFANDELLEGFELAWARQNAGPQGIIEFLQRHSLPEPWPLDLLSELVQIDIERAWQHWARSLQPLVAAGTTDDVLSSFHSIPRLPDYRNGKTAVVFESPTELRSLCQSELKARDIWGDAVGCQYYERTFSTQIERAWKFQPCTVELILSDPRRSETVWGDPRRSETVWSGTIEGQCVFGRRRRGEERNTRITHSEVQRIVIAETSEVKISREQISVLRLNEEYLHVCNKSPVNAVILESVWRDPVNRLLDPLKSTICRLPFFIRVADRLLRFT